MKRKLFASLLILCAVGLAAAQRPPRKTPPKTSAAPATKPKFKAIWEMVNYKEDLNLTHVFFVNEKAGWVAGAAASIIHTSDGGDTWTAQLGGDPQSKETEIRNLRFADATHGWATQKTPRHSNFCSAPRTVKPGNKWGRSPSIIPTTSTPRRRAGFITIRRRSSRPRTEAAPGRMFTGVSLRRRWKA